MTGSHGAGDPSETLTPLVAWGAGVRSAQYIEPTSPTRHSPAGLTSHGTSFLLHFVNITSLWFSLCLSLCASLSSTYSVASPLSSSITHSLFYSHFKIYFFTNHSQHTLFFLQDWLHGFSDCLRYCWDFLFFFVFSFFHYFFQFIAQCDRLSWLLSFWAHYSSSLFNKYIIILSWLTVNFHSQTRTWTVHRTVTEYNCSKNENWNWLTVKIHCFYY